MLQNESCIRLTLKKTIAMDNESDEEYDWANIASDRKVVKLAQARRSAKKGVKHNVKCRNGLVGISRSDITSNFNDAILVRLTGEPPINSDKLIKGWRDIRTISRGKYK